MLHLPLGGGTYRPGSSRLRGIEELARRLSHVVRSHLASVTALQAAPALLARGVQHVVAIDALVSPGLHAADTLGARDRAGGTHLRARRLLVSDPGSARVLCLGSCGGRVDGGGRHVDVSRLPFDTSCHDLMLCWVVDG